MHGAKKRPIDHIRDGAFVMNVGDAADASPVMEFVPLGERILIVKERSLWEVALADQIDPDRTNAAIPHSQQRILARGTSDPLVGRILLQAKRLLDPDALPSTCDPVAGLHASLAFLHELATLQTEADDFRRLTEDLGREFSVTALRREGFSVPAIGNVNARGKAFVQSADHAVRNLWQLVCAFDRGLPEEVSWPKLKRRLEEGDDKAKELARMADQFSPGFTLLRKTRNAVEHPKPGQKVVFQDYRLKADGRVYAPTITVVEQDAPLSETDIGDYHTWVIGFLVDAFEAWLVNLCALHVAPSGGFETVVIKLEPEMRRYPAVAFSYGSWIGDQLVPHCE